MPSRQVFVRLLAPFEPFGPNNNLSNIMSLYRRRAGISQAAVKACTHSVATRLLEVGRLLRRSPR
jgi:hypothetical protein